MKQDDPQPQRLELESLRTGGHPDRKWDVQDTYLHILVVMAGSQSVLVLGHHLALEKFLSGWVVGGGTVKIASTPNSSLKLFKLS